MVKAHGGHSSYSVRMTLHDTLKAALNRRETLLSELYPDTTCVRLLHGIAEDAPGVAIDRYGSVLLVQTWRDPIDESDLPKLAEAASQAVGTALTPVWNHRGEKGRPFYRKWHRPELPEALEGTELGLTFDVRPRHKGIDPLLFLDFRAARRWIRDHAEGKTVLNLFSYTCGIGVAALAGGAKEVMNVDFAESALKTGQDNCRRNKLDLAKFRTHKDDVFPALRQLAGLSVGGRRSQRLRYRELQARQFDLVVLDPPRYAKSRWGVVDVKNDYPSLLKPALLATAPGGTLLATNNAGDVTWDDWIPVVERTAQKAGVSIGPIERMMPELDFPSFDDQPPLKAALITRASEP